DRLFGAAALLFELPRQTLTLAVRDLLQLAPVLLGPLGRLLLELEADRRQFGRGLPLDLLACSGDVAVETRPVLRLRRFEFFAPAGVRFLARRLPRTRDFLVVMAGERSELCLQLCLEPGANSLDHVAETCLGLVIGHSQALSEPEFLKSRPEKRANP